MSPRPAKQQFAIMREFSDEAEEMESHEAEPVQAPNDQRVPSPERQQSSVEPEGELRVAPFIGAGCECGQTRGRDLREHAVHADK